MFVPYSIEASDIKHLVGYGSLGAIDLSAEQKDAYKFLEQQITKDSSFLDGDSIKKGWMPTGQHYDFFISYSHNDESEAKKLVSWLRGKGLTCFLDSLYWQNCDSLLKAIDDKYCKDSNGYYNYEKRNYTTSLVHALLSIAILEAINQCDFAFFIKSPSSTVIQTQGFTSTTQSPWLYEEVNYMTTIEKRIPRCCNALVTRQFSRGGNLVFECQAHEQPVNMNFSIPMNKLYGITSSALNSIGANNNAFLLELLRRTVLTKKEEQQPIQSLFGKRMIHENLPIGRK